MVSLFFLLIVLSLIYTVGGIIALLLRKSAAAPSAAGMRLLWTVILLLSVLPMPFFSAQNDVTIYRTDETVTVRLGESRTPTAAEDPTQTNPPAAENTDTARSPKEFRLDVSFEKHLRTGIYAAVSVWLLGAAAILTFRTAQRISLCRRLYQHAAPCRDARMLSLCHTVAAQLGIKKAPPLFVFDKGITLSPCVCGTVRPAVFISETQTEMSDDAVSLLLLHELCHIRRGDQWLSLLQTVTASLHWFHPLKKPVQTALSEDMEFACDAAVLRLHGEQSRPMYIRVILDIAETIAACREKNADLCAAQNTSAQFLIRRYNMMKQTKPHKLCRLGTALSVCLALLLIAGNILFTAACTAPTDITLSDPLIASAVAEYFGLSSPDALTAHHLSLITSFEIQEADFAKDDIASADGTTYTPVRIVINGGTVYADGTLYTVTDAVPSTHISDGYEIETLPEMLTEEQMENFRTSLRAADSDGFFENKVASFYAALPAERIGDGYAFLQERSAYFLDPDAGEREITNLLETLASADLLATRAAKNGTVDLSDLSTMPNLTHVAVSERFTVQNAPANLSVITHTQVSAATAILRLADNPEEQTILAAKLLILKKEREEIISSLRAK